MADDKAVFAAVYPSTQTAVADLRAVEELHEEKFVGAFDAAVIDKEGGKPRIVKRMDRPRVRAIPEAFGGGTLPRKELKEAANELKSSDAGLIVVGDPTIEKGLDTALKGAVRVVKHDVNATNDEIVSELKEALSS